MSRRFYFRSQVTRYVILFIGRDGSTYLTSAFLTHPDIKPEFEKMSELREAGKGAKEQLEWLRSFMTPPWLGRYAAVGFKTKLADVFDLDGFARLLVEKQARIIHLQRRNRVKAVVSRINALRIHESTGHWNLYHDSDRLPPVTIRPDEFEAILKEREAADLRLNDFVSRLRLRTLKITYEELLVNRDGKFKDILRFLGVRPFPVAGNTLKNTSDNLREALLNFDELYDRYIGTPYEPMFEEVLVGNGNGAGAEARLERVQLQEVGK